MYVSLLQFFHQIFIVSSAQIFQTSLILLLSILLLCFCKWDSFVISVSDGLLLMYRHTTNLCTLILYFADLLSF